MKKATVMFLVLTVTLLASCGSPEPPPLFEPPAAEETLEEEAYIYVDIKGEVRNPGIYKLSEGKRIYNLIDLAGGTKESASLTTINLSEVLKDGHVYDIPEIGKEPAKPSIPDEETSLVSINEASQETLETLPKIGPATATSIIEYREENGPFEFLEDIMNVSGIGEATYEGLEALICL